MKSNWKVVFFVVHCFTISFGQQINIKVNNLVGKPAVLASLEGGNISFIDTIYLSNEGEFEFNFDAVKNHRGFYRLSLNNNKSLNFIYDNENVVIETDANYILDSLKIIKSKSNKLYYEFVKLNKDYKTKTELLQLILARYPKEDDYYQIKKKSLFRFRKIISTM